MRVTLGTADWPSVGIHLHSHHGMFCVSVPCCSRGTPGECDGSSTPSPRPGGENQSFILLLRERRGEILFHKKPQVSPGTRCRHFKCSPELLCINFISYLHSILSPSSHILLLEEGQSAQVDHILELLGCSRWQGDHDCLLTVHKLC